MQQKISSGSVLTIAILFFIIGICISLEGLPLIAVASKGKIVTMQVAKKESHYKGKSYSYNFQLVYNNKLYKIGTSKKFYQIHEIGDDIEVKYLDGMSSIVFPGQTTIYYKILIAVFFILSAAASFIYFKCKRWMDYLDRYASTPAPKKRRRRRMGIFLL
jgi:hypothetical protein